METNKDRLTQLNRIYQAYGEAAAPYQAGAACGQGCAFCCTHFGVLDVTTLEGTVIGNWIEKRPKKLRRDLMKAVARNRVRKLRGEVAVCPFLNRKQNCRIYALRPFSCRQLYSLERCGPRGPVVSRQAVALARDTVAQLQALDENGYSGHLTYVLDLLDRPEFRSLYRQGGFNPGAIHELGRRYGLRVHRHLIARQDEGPVKLSVPTDPGGA